MSKKSNSNKTFKLLVAGAFLNTTITEVNELVVTGEVRAKDELRSFKGVFLLFKNYAKAFKSLRMESNRKQDYMDLKTRKLVAAKLKSQGLEYSEERDLEEGYYSAAGDVSEFMDIWIKASDAVKLDVLREKLNEIKEGL